MSTDKTISKWETGKGYPDITLLEPIAIAFRISVTELISGNPIHNANVSANMMRSKFYVCPICGNVIHSMGECVIGCHGIQLYPEGKAEARFKIRGVRKIFFYCNHDGLFSTDIVKGIDDKESGYDNSQERKELEKLADKLFG